VTASPRFRGDSPVEFTSYLAELKHRGCNLLVTGEVAERVTRQATRKLLGSAAERRRRVLVLADRDADDGDAFLPHGVGTDDDDVTVIAWCAGARSAAASAPTAEQSGGLADLQADVCSAMTGYEIEADGLDAAELRLGVVTVCTLLDRYDHDAVAHALDAVTSQVQQVRGMGHYHLPVPDDADEVAALAPLFDARIELRKPESAPPQQRWHVPEYGTTTWVAL
jgi:hypothetical protein